MSVFHTFLTYVIEWLPGNYNESCAAFPAALKGRFCT